MADTPIDVKKTQSAPAPVPATSDPWRVLRNEMDRLFDRFSGGFGMPSFRRMFDWESPFQGSSFSVSAPAVDVSEDEKAYKICAELPGLEAKDIDIQINNDMLTIKGEKRQEQERKDQNFHMTERSYGSFQRSFALPDGVDRDKITADLQKGVLTLTLPKSAEAQKPAKKIEVKSQG